jgi:glycolate oxidase FAD binding subunit
LATQGTIVSALVDSIGPHIIQSREHWERAQHETFLQAVTSSSAIEGIAYPTTTEELGQIMAQANQNRWHVLICGNGSKLSWGTLGQDIHLVVSTAKLDRLIEHAVDDFTITLEAGMKLAELQAILAKAGQYLPIDPLYAQDATLGGIVATANAGSWRHRYGGVRDLLLGISLIRADGQLAKAGGRVVKNVAGYDLMKLFTGSYGTLGILTQLTFRVYALPETSETILLTGEAPAIAQFAQQILLSALTPTALDLISPRIVTQLGLGETVGLVVRFQAIAASVQEQRRRLFELAHALQLHSHSFNAQAEQTVWQQLQNCIQSRPTNDSILCKIGIRPTAAVSLLQQIGQRMTEQTLIHMSSGLGLIRLESNPLIQANLLAVRQSCEAEGGFLSLLEATPDLKQQLDVWGYVGNAQAQIQGLKHQFDPNNILNPGKSIGEK